MTKIEYYYEVNIMYYNEIRDFYNSLILTVNDS